MMWYFFLFNRRKLQAKLLEAEQANEALQVKVSGLEKQKVRMSQEMEDLAIEAERVSCCFILTLKSG